MSLPYSGQFVAVTSYKEKPMEHTNIKPEAAHNRWDAVELTSLIVFLFY